VNASRLNTVDMANDTEYRYRGTALFQALKNKRFQNAMYLLQLGASGRTDSAFSADESSLVVAMNEGMDDVIRHLLDTGAVPLLIKGFTASVAGAPHDSFRALLERSPVSSFDVVELAAHGRLDVMSLMYATDSSWAADESVLCKVLEKLVAAKDLVTWTYSDSLLGLDQDLDRIFGSLVRSCEQRREWVQSVGTRCYRDNLVVAWAVRQTHLFTAAIVLPRVVDLVKRWVGDNWSFFLSKMKRSGLVLHGPAVCAAVLVGYHDGLDGDAFVNALNGMTWTWVAQGDRSVKLSLDGLDWMDAIGARAYVYESQGTPTVDFLGLSGRVSRHSVQLVQHRSAQHLCDSADLAMDSFVLYYSHDVHDLQIATRKGAWDAVMNRRFTSGSFAPSCHDSVRLPMRVLQYSSPPFDFAFRGSASFETTRTISSPTASTSNTSLVIESEWILQLHTMQGHDLRRLRIQLLNAALRRCELNGGKPCVYLPDEVYAEPFEAEDVVWIMKDSISFVLPQQIRGSSKLRTETAKDWIARFNAYIRSYQEYVCLEMHHTMRFVSSTSAASNFVSLTNVCPTLTKNLSFIPSGEDLLALVAESSSNPSITVANLALSVVDTLQDLNIKLTRTQLCAIDEGQDTVCKQMVQMHGWIRLCKSQMLATEAVECVIKEACKQDTEGMALEKPSGATSSDKTFACGPPSGQRRRFFVRKSPRGIVNGNHKGLGIAPASEYRIAWLRDQAVQQE